MTELNSEELSGWVENTARTLGHETRYGFWDWVDALLLIEKAPITHQGRDILVTTCAETPTMLPLTIAAILVGATETIWSRDHMMN